MLSRSFSPGAVVIKNVPVGQVSIHAGGAARYAQP
jgi:hypothetical protein